MNRLMLAALLMWAVFVTGCGRSIPPATPMTFDNVDSEANNGKYVALEGYFRLPTMASISDTMLIELHEKPDAKSRSVNVSIPIGSGANQMEKPPKSYKDDDMKLHASDGTVVGLNDRVRVTGGLVWMKSGPTQHATWLEKPIVVEKLK